MNAAGWLDVGLIVLIGVIAAIYAIYSFSPVRAQRVMLSWLFKLVGARVYGWMSPRAGGCDHCAGARPALRKIQTGNKPKRLTNDSKP